MAGSPEPVETPKLGIKATIAGLVFVVTILAGFGAATAAAYDGRVDHGDDYGEEHSEETDDSHADEGDDHADDDAEEHSDE